MSIVYTKFIRVTADGQINNNFMDFCNNELRIKNIIYDGQNLANHITQNRFPVTICDAKSVNDCFKNMTKLEENKTIAIVNMDRVTNVHNNAFFNLTMDRIIQQLKINEPLREFFKFIKLTGFNTLQNNRKLGKIMFQTCSIKGIMSENVYLSFNFDDMSIESVAISAVLNK